MKDQLNIDNEFIIPMFKFFKMKGLIFVLFEDTQFGYRAFESRHSIMVAAKSRVLLIEAIREEVDKHFDGKFYGKIVLREFIDQEIKL